ncbi:MAG TPA: VWA domain-containing protein [Vicinamibacterales bacterium]|nr:VWA domain-containing protein [Vicinamibacterales bacterium]
MRGSATLPLAALACAIGLHAQQAPGPQIPSFRSGIDLVQVDVSVLDRDRTPVRGLTAADFTLLVDGTPTPIEAFSAVTLGAAAARTGGAPPWTRTVSPDVVRNGLPREGRLMVVLFDHSIRPQQMPLARRIATAAIDSLGPADVAAVMHTIGGTREQNFTQDRAKLLAAVDSDYMGIPVTTLLGPPGDRSAPVSESFGGSGVDLSQCPCGLCSLDTIRRIAESVVDLPARRKSVLFIGTNVKTLEELDPRDACPETNFTRDRMLRALGVANLTVHTIDPTGLESLSIKAEDPRRAVVTPSIVADRSQNLKRQGNLQSLAAEAGGRAIANANKPQEAIASIINESSVYYSLGFRPHERETPGRYHDISVRVNRRDATVHARKGFYSGGRPAPSVALDVNEAPAALNDALVGSWPVSDLPVAVAVSPFADPAGPRPFAAITIATQRQSDTSSARPINVIATAFDDRGQSVNFHHQALDLGAALKASGSAEYEVLSRLPLDPGRYEIRAGVHDAASERIGTAHAYIDVPDFARDRLSASAIVLQASPSPLTAPEGLFGKTLVVRPTARRTFSPSDKVTALLRVYQGRGNAPADVTIESVVQDADAKKVFAEVSTLTAALFSDAAHRAADVELTLPLERLPPGDYLLTMSARRDKKVERRDVRFDVK